MDSPDSDCSTSADAFPADFELEQFAMTLTRPHCRAVSLCAEVDLNCRRVPSPRCCALPGCLPLTQQSFAAAGFGSVAFVRVTSMRYLRAPF